MGGGWGSGGFDRGAIDFLRSDLKSRLKFSFESNQQTEDSYEIMLKENGRIIVTSAGVFKLTEARSSLCDLSLRHTQPRTLESIVKPERFL